MVSHSHGRVLPSTPFPPIAHPIVSAKKLFLIGPLHGVHRWVR